ncbi:MAG TPA: tetratricopeptide repeat protein [Candidatus Lachnoclostridium stercorigallinarum]|uniref:Tetratricopeptide repeat protein n=1 Tax=Candidatus Lachnoclostridium stercorigallinarum TaxID=2838634 RepID=A0A9D2GGK9_9FIRM|nr:tetratricopeptide repeat protein [Candidatus Lachnoclostridium stercorigallinarum]
MDYVRRNHQIANSYYNLGLEKAQIRDLSGAAECLKKSLHFNKFQTDARNLLGLIYYEMGEVADAIVQWVISLNLQPEDNRCDYYLDEIQRKPGRLEVASQTVKKYNQALWYAQTDAYDLAILQLVSAVEENDHYVKAQLLLALLYISQENYTRAGKALRRVLQIDRSNRKALWYMSIVKENTGRAEVERQQMDNAFSHTRLEDDNIILPPTYRESTGGQVVLNIFIGVVLGVAAFMTLVMPSIEERLNSEHNQELISYSEQLSQSNIRIDELERQLAQAEGERDSAAASLNSVVSDSGGTISQYASLARILQAYRDDDFRTAAQIYAGMNTALITDQNLQPILEEIQTDMTERGWQVLDELGDAAVGSGDYAGAITYYDASLRLNGANPGVMYDKAAALQAQGQTEEADDLFDQIIENYPDTDFAAMSREQRGY